MQRIFLAATGPTSDEILDMPDTSIKAKQDMIAEQKDSCQKALSLLLRLTLSENRGRSGRDPIMGDIFELRREVLNESKNPIYYRRPLPEISTRNKITGDDNLYYEEEKEKYRPRGGLGIDLAEIAASSVMKIKQEERSPQMRGTYREQCDYYDESVSSESVCLEEVSDQGHERRNRARPKHTITATEIGMFNGMKLDPKDNMRSCQKIVDLGKRLNIHDEDIELMINQLLSINIRINDVSLHKRNISGETKKETYDKRLREIKSTGLLIFCKNRAHDGKDPAQTVEELLQFEKDLPGLQHLKYCGHETKWEELQTFAVRYDRRSKHEAEKKGNQDSNYQGDSKQQGLRRSERLKAQGHYAQQGPKYVVQSKSFREQRDQFRPTDFQRRGRSQSRGVQRKPNLEQRPPFIKNASKQTSSTYVSKEEWDRLTPEQQNKIREQRAKQKATV
ncbi:hypothetical protein PO909_000280, partial [Leuciscus waleckii]